MSDTKASPGPWRWGWVDTDGDVVADDALHDGNQNKMGIYDESGRRKEAFHEVNRALIAAAPEMAEMLRELEWMGGPSGECPMCEAAPERTREVDCKPHPQFPTFVIAGTGRMVTTGGKHDPDCRLVALLKKLG